MNEIRAQWDEEVRQARLHPRGLGGDPFRKRISLWKNDGASDSVGQPQSNLPDSFAMEITPPKGVGLANQPIVIDKKQLGELVKKDIGKAELYREGENNKIAVQVDKDEIIFIDNFKEGANRYVLYFDRAGNAQQNNPVKIQNQRIGDCVLLGKNQWQG